MQTIIKNSQDKLIGKLSVGSIYISTLTNTIAYVNDFDDGVYTLITLYAPATALSSFDIFCIETEREISCWKLFDGEITFKNE